MTEDEVRQAGWTQSARWPGFTDAAGPFWSRRDGDGWQYAVLSSERHVNNRGVVHGGLLLTLADHALGIAVWESIGREACATIQLDMQFLATTLPGELVEVAAEITRSTKSVVFVRGVLSSGSRVVSTAAGIWKRLAPQSGEMT